MKRRSVVIGGALVLLFVTGGALLFYWMLHPALSVIDPVTPLPDDTVSIVGRNFGEAPGELLFDNIPLARACHSVMESHLYFFQNAE